MGLVCLSIKRGGLSELLRGGTARDGGDEEEKGGCGLLMS